MRAVRYYRVRFMIRVRIRIFDQFYGCLLYGDDMLLLSHSVNAMRRTLMVCDQFAADFDMKFNGGKSI